MARYSDAKCKLCRREGIKLYLKGERCLTDNCAMERRPFPPGEQGRRGRKLTPYGQMLREKQKAKKIYGVLETQFEKYYRMASRMKGKTGENLLGILERRLDNVVYRMGFANSRSEARQMVRHGHFLVNGTRVNIPSFLVSSDDSITLSDRGKENIEIQESLEKANIKSRVPSWLEMDYEKVEGKVLSFPSREDIDIPVDENRIVELYSK